MAYGYLQDIVPRDTSSTRPRRMSKRLANLITIVVVLSSTIFSQAQAQEKEREKRVGVTISAFFNTEAGMADAISEAVGRALSKTLKVQTIAGQKAQSKLPSAALSETCIGDSDCLIAAGRALDVDELLMLIVVGGGDELKIEATWANMDTGETALRAAIVVPIVLDEMEKILSNEASALIPGVELRNPAPVHTDNKVHDSNPQDTSGSNTVSTGGSTGDLTAKPGGGSHHLSPLGKSLFIGGALTVGGWLGYGAFRRTECESFSSCNTGPNRDGLSTVVDIVGVAGTVALTAAVFMYYTSDDESSSSASARLAPTIGKDSLGFAYGGQF